MNCAITGKTGFTAKAGYCYVAAVEESGRKYCVALLACGWPNNKNYKWADAKKLFQYGLENYPEKNKEEQWERFRQHMSEKYSASGYIRLWIPNSPNSKRLRVIQNFIDDTVKLRSEFDRIYAMETARR